MIHTLSVPDTLNWGKLATPTNPTEFWTLALTVATVALVVVAFFGLRSLALSKSDMKNRTTREAAQAAIDHCDEMARELLPLYLAVLRDLAAKNIRTFVSDPGEVSFEKTEEVQKINSALAWMHQLDRPLLDRATDIMNRLETWSG